MTEPLVTDTLQLAGFLFGGWLLFRFTDWVYRGRFEGDHGQHGPRDPEQLPDDERRARSAAHR